MIRRWHLGHNNAHGLAGLSGFLDDLGNYYDTSVGASSEADYWGSAVGVGTHGTGGTPIQTSSPSYSDAGTNVVGSTVQTAASNDLLGSLLNLGSTYLKGQNQQAIAKNVAATQYPGSTTTYNPNGQIVTASPQPMFSTPSSGFNLSSLLSNPLVLGGIGLGAYLLFKKRK